jgi:hypothetical protein
VVEEMGYRKTQKSHSCHSAILLCWGPAGEGREAFGGSRKKA